MTKSLPSFLVGLVLVIHVFVWTKLFENLLFVYFVKLKDDK